MLGKLGLWHYLIQVFICLVFVWMAYLLRRVIQVTDYQCVRTKKKFNQDIGNLEDKMLTKENNCVTNG